MAAAPLLTKDQAISEALEIISFMSGSDDFAPGGKAYEGWVRSQAMLNEIRIAGGHAVIPAAVGPRIVNVVLTTETPDGHQTHAR